MATNGLPRLGANQRAQHALLAGAVLTALGTGVAGSLLPAAGPGGGGRSWHIGSGLIALGVIAYHAVYLAVRGYVEGHGLRYFPLRWTAADTAAVPAALRRLAGKGPPPEGGEFRASQKALYLWTAIGVPAAAATGIALGFWESVGSLAHLDAIAELHRGLALLLLGAILWHLYGVLTWEGSWAPEWSWLTGVLDEEKARRKLPVALRLHREREAAEAGAVPGDDAERARERQLHQREEVEAELEKGNRLALEERYVEALYHYRRALELFPGYSQARYNLARVLARMGEREEAVAAYRLFLEAEPFHPLSRKAQEAIEELSEGDRP